MSRMDPIKVTLGVLVLILAGVAGYLGYNYYTQCAGANGVSCTGTGVYLEGDVCTAKVKSCGQGTADEHGVCQFSGSGGGLGSSNIVIIVIAGVLLVVSVLFLLARANSQRVRRMLSVRNGAPLLTRAEIETRRTDHPDKPVPNRASIGAARAYDYVTSKIPGIRRTSRPTGTGAAAAI